MSGKDLSFNNIVDGDTALSCVINFEKPSCVIVNMQILAEYLVIIIYIDAYKNAYFNRLSFAFGGCNSI